MKESNTNRDIAGEMDGVAIMVQSAISNNDKIYKNIMIESRVFTCERKGSPELLALLSRDAFHSEYPRIWGHIFKLKEERVFAVSILNLDSLVSKFVSLNTILMFDRFWYSIEEAGSWYPARGEACAIGVDFQDASRKLCKLIESFDPNDLEKEHDIRPVSLYPFPNPFAQRLFFDQWLKKESNNI